MAGPDCFNTGRFDDEIDLAGSEGFGRHASEDCFVFPVGHGVIELLLHSCAHRPYSEHQSANVEGPFKSGRYQLRACCAVQSGLFRLGTPSVLVHVPGTPSDGLLNRVETTG